MTKRIDFQTHPRHYKHWQLSCDGAVARLSLDVDESGGLMPGYELKLNSYDLGVDIELADAITRLRFEHPEVSVVMLTSAKENTFCAGANIRMLAASSHVHKVNFCKFTNETRNSMEDASAHSDQTYVACLHGPAAGGGYELALAADKILLIDDGNAAVSLPEVPLLAVLPGTGGLTRLVDKRGVRRDVADYFCTLEEGLQGGKALQARLVDEIYPRSEFAAGCAGFAASLASLSAVQREANGPALDPAVGHGVELPEIDKSITEHGIDYSSVAVRIDRPEATATVTIDGPQTSAPADGDAAHAQGADFWPLVMLRELDDALLELRLNETQLGILILKSRGNTETLLGYDALLQEAGSHWFLREVKLLACRVLKRLDLTSRSIFALLEPDSCFAGFLAELVFAADRSYMLEGTFEETPGQQPALLTLSQNNFSSLPMVNGLSRLATRFIGQPEVLPQIQNLMGQPLDAQACDEQGLITFVFDDLDWTDEIRLAVEGRAAMSPDALVGMEANLRFAGPETMESKIFARLSAWQNWIFQRPNAVGAEGALPLYGSGKRPKFDKERI
jgi:benzoyl-CoA-dihydrodiol lyase